MALQRLLKSRTALVLFAGLVYLTWKAVAQHFGIDDSAGIPGTDALGLGSGGVALVWALGHCDSLDGPVVTLARKALDTGNVNLVLPWVRAEDEGEIRNAFEHASSVRKLGAEARKLADAHFFETLVRVHRASEGAPYTGLKPAGRDLGPAIPAADHALEDGSAEPVVKLVTDAVARGIRERFQAAWSKRGFGPDEVEAGREYVEAYVHYVHFVERLFGLARESAHGHAHAPEQSAAHVH